MKLLPICFALIVFGLSLANAEVFWFEVEEFDEEKSNPTFNEQGLNVVWAIKEDPEAFNGKYMSATGANRDVVEAAAGLVYVIPDVEKTTGWKLWVRCIMATSGSDSFFHQLSQDSGKKWGLAVADHGGAQWMDWEWHSWDIEPLSKGEENALRIAERENNAMLDIICLRNDGMEPTAEEYEAYLKEQEAKPDIAVNARGKLAGTWGKIKSDASLDR